MLGCGLCSEELLNAAKNRSVAADPASSKNRMVHALIEAATASSHACSADSGDIVSKAASAASLSKEVSAVDDSAAACAPAHGFPHDESDGATWMRHCCGGRSWRLDAQSKSMSKSKSMRFEPISCTQCHTADHADLASASSLRLDGIPHTLIAPPLADADMTIASSRFEPLRMPRGVLDFICTVGNRQPWRNAGANTQYMSQYLRLILTVNFACALEMFLFLFSFSFHCHASCHLHITTDHQFTSVSHC